MYFICVFGQHNYSFFFLFKDLKKCIFAEFWSNVLQTKKVKLKAVLN